MRTTNQKFRLALASLATAAALLALAVPLTGAAAAPRTAAASPLGLATIQSLLTRTPAAGPGQVAPLWRFAGRRLGRYPGQHAAPDTIGEPGGYDPAELRAYLGLHGTGAGQTVAVTEAYDVQNPFPVSIYGDQDDVTNSLAGYDSWYKLRPACSATVTTECFSLTFDAPHGTTVCGPVSGKTFPCYIDGYNWVTEAVLDVELIHTLAPRASIKVVEGYNQTNASMLAALTYAQSLHPAAVSDSWGEAEFSGEQALYRRCPAAGAPCVFSSGDNGNYAECLAEDASGVNCGGYPAASPAVLAVGGTTLDLSASGKVISQSAWADGGGGISAYQRHPGYQRTDRYTGGRGVPDVSFDANPDSGIAIYYVLVAANLHTDSGWEEVGGTSVGAPAWAAILASADQLRAAAGRPPLTIGQIHAAVYAKAATEKAIADITTGANGICGPQCSAGPGYDLVTGQGSPERGIDTYLASR
jgi:hypothetical protein